MTNADLISENWKIGKELLPLLANVLVVSEKIIWLDEMEDVSCQKFLVVNIFTSDEPLKQQLMSRISSDSILQTLNDSCSKNRILCGYNREKLMKFESVTTSSLLEIPISGI